MCDSITDAGTIQRAVVKKDSLCGLLDNAYAMPFASVTWQTERGEAMFVTFEIGKLENLEQYKEVFFDSALFHHYFQDDDRLTDSLREALQKKELFAVYHKEEIVGAMEIRFKGFFGAFPYLALLGVKKGWRGQGVGKKMLGFFEEAARQLGHSRTSLMVSGFNVRAKNLYQSLGYRKIGMLENAFKEGIDENIMVKEL